MSIKLGWPLKGELAIILIRFQIQTNCHIVLWLPKGYGKLNSVYMQFKAKIH